MSTARHFHDLPIRRVTPEAARAVALTFAVPPELRDAFAFEPGQFLTLRADIDGQQQRPPVQDGQEPRRWRRPCLHR